MRKTRRLVHRAVAVVGLVVLAAGCDLNFTNPGRITEDALTEQAAIPIILNGLIGDFEDAYGTLILHTALVSGELTFSGTRSWLDFFGKGDLKPSDTNVSWEPAATSRWTAVGGVERLTELQADADDIATANLYAGFIHRVMGETFCEATFDGGPAMPNGEYWSRALTHFQAAASGSGDIGLAAIGGQAQVQLIQGNYSQAASLAAQVPDNFVWVAHYTDNFTALIWDETVNQTQASVFGTPIADLGPNGDPRVPWVDLGRKGAGGTVDMYRQKKYVNRSDDIALVKGWEMRLIEAEAMIRGGSVAQGVDMINYVRSAFDMPDVNATTQADALAALEHERLVTLWMENRRLRDAIRFNSPSLQGKETCFPFSDSEINSNSNLSGG